MAALRAVWPIRSLLAGAAGTASLSLAYQVEHRIKHTDKPLDYDDSLVPGRIVVTILDLPHLSAREEYDLGLVLRWGYGSAFGLWHGALKRRLGEPWAGILFFTTLMTATLTMFPLLGRTPPPQRWPRGYLTTSVATHVAYATTVAVVDDRIA